MKRKYDLICFDFDGTLAITHDNQVIWAQLHKRYDVPEELERENRELYKTGAINVQEWMAKDVGAWQERGARKHEIEEEIVKHLRLHQHAADTLHALKAAGCKLVLISGGLRIALETVFPDHPFDEVFIGSIEFDHEGYIAGWTHSQYGDDDGKRIALRMVAEREGISLDRTVFVGDGRNDILALREAGLGVAFNCQEPDVRQAANIVIDSKDYRDLLPLILKE